MKGNPGLGMLVACLLLSAPAARSQQAGASKPALDSPAQLCAPGKRCTKFARQLTYPVHALSHASDAAFARHARGLNWLGRSGTVSLTVRRPPDYAGGPVRVILFHQVYSDAPGDIRFAVTPVTLNHGNSFETYGSVATNTVASPESTTILVEQSVTITPGNGWSANGQWWYLDIVRQGTFEGGLRLMSVALAY